MFRFGVKSTLWSVIRKFLYKLADFSFNKELNAASLYMKKRGLWKD